MNEHELSNLWAYMYECLAALNLIINHEDRANLHGSGRKVFLETINETENFMKFIRNKYGSEGVAIRATVNIKN